MKRSASMNSLRRLCFAAACLIAGAAFSQAPAPSRVRGTITAFDGTTLSVKTREGADVKIELAPNATFAYMKKVGFTDIKPGTPLGTTTVKSADGKVIARELHLFNPNKPIPNEGSRPWDLEPGSMMTNARVVATKASELTLGYGGVEQNVVVPADTPMVIAV